jgi:hypothetical protein
MLLLSLVPLTAIGVIVYVFLSGQLSNFSDRLGQTEEALRSDVVGANLAGTADALAGEIDAYLLERIRDVRRWAEAPEVIEVVRQANRVALRNGMAKADSQTVETALDAQAEQGQSPYFLALDAGGDETGQTLQLSAINYLFREQEKTKGTFVEMVVTEASAPWRK